MCAEAKLPPQAEVLAEAVRTRSSISAQYGGLRRLVSPHVVGFKDGELHCWGYQFGGGSSSGEVGLKVPRSWRCFRVREFTDVILLRGLWHSGSGDITTQSCVETIVVVVEER